jgi:putative dehydrogenase
MSAAKAKGAVGIVGLGIMGGAFAKNLAAAGWRVVGYDIDAARCRVMARLGVEIAKSAAAVAKDVSIIITSLPSPKALDVTVKSIVNARLPRRIVVEASTFTLADKERAERALRNAGHIMLDSPVSGTGAQAQTKDLVIYASGDTKSIAKVKRVYADFSRKAYDLGAFGNGSKMKYVANHLVAINNVASAEAMVLGMKAGLDPQVIFEMVTSGAGNSRVFELRAPMMVADRYDQATMKMSVWQKDMQVIGDYARQIGCPTPMFSATLPVYAAAMKSHAEEDTAAVCAVLEARAGLKRKGRSSRRKKR